MPIGEKLRGLGRKIRLYAALFLLVVIVLFIGQNAEVIQLNFLIWSFTTRRSLLVILLLLIGAGIGLLLQGYVRLRWNRSVKAAAQRVAAEQSENRKD